MKPKSIVKFEKPKIQKNNEINEEKKKMIPLKKTPSKEKEIISFFQNYLESENQKLDQKIKNAEKISENILKTDILELKLKTIKENKEFAEKIAKNYKEDKQREKKVKDLHLQQVFESKKVDFSYSQSEEAKLIPVKNFAQKRFTKKKRSWNSKFTDFIFYLNFEIFF